MEGTSRGKEYERLRDGHVYWRSSDAVWGMG